MLNWPPKDPDEVLDYGVNWADADNPVLEDGEVLLTSHYSITEGTVAIDRQDFDASGETTVWLSGGTLGEVCDILNRVTTSGGRTYDQSAKLRIRKK